MPDPTLTHVVLAIARLPQFSAYPCYILTSRAQKAHCLHDMATIDAAGTACVWTAANVQHAIAASYQWQRDILSRPLVRAVWQMDI